MTDKLAELIASLDETGLVDEFNNQDLGALKAKIVQVADAIPIATLGFYVLIKMEKVGQTMTILDENGDEKELYLTSDDLNAREEEANSKGWVLAFGPTAYLGFAGCEGPEDWGLELGDYVEFQSYNGIRSAFDSSKSLRVIPDSNIISKVKVITPKRRWWQWGKS